MSSMTRCQAQHLWRVLSAVTSQNVAVELHQSGVSLHPVVLYFTCFCMHANTHPAGAGTALTQAGGSSGEEVALKPVKSLVQGEGTGSNVIVMRIQGPLCFANAARTKERILGFKVLHTPMRACSSSQSASCRQHLHSVAEHCTRALAGICTHIDRMMTICGCRVE